MQNLGLIPNWIRLALAVLVLGASAATQNPGDCLVVTGRFTLTASALLRVTPNGAITTLLSRPNDSIVGVTIAPRNQGLFLVIEDPSWQRHLLRWQNGVATTLLANTPVAKDVIVNRAGNPVILAAGTPLRIEEVVGVGQTSTIATIRSANPVTSFNEDPSTGDWLVFTRNDFASMTMHRVDAAGRVTQRTFGLLADPWACCATGHAHADYRDGTFLVVASYRAARVDLSTNTVTTMSASPRSIASVSIDYDAIGDRFAVVTDRFAWWRPPAAPVVITTFPNEFPVDATLAESRMLTGQAPPVAGAPWPIELAVPGEANQAYLATASLGFQPGIRVTGGRIVPQNADGLFALSLQRGPWFQGFAGTLSSRGTATLRLQLPTAARGLRFFVAAATYDRGGVRRISEPLGVTVR